MVEGESVWSNGDNDDDGGFEEGFDEVVVVVVGLGVLLWD